MASGEGDMLSVMLPYSDFFCMLVSDIDICPSSIGAYFSSGGYSCVAGVQKMKRPKLHHIAVPQINFSASDTEFCCTQEFYEWLGFVAAGW